MFRKLMATSPVWMPVPIRLAMGAIFVAHGTQKVLGSFSGPGLNKWISFPAPFPFMRPAWLWMGAAAFAELIGGILVFFGISHATGSVLTFLRNVERCDRSTLAKVFYACRHGVCNGLVGDVFSPADLWWGNGFHRSGPVQRPQEVAVSNGNGTRRIG